MILQLAQKNNYRYNYSFLALSPCEACYALLEIAQTTIREFIQNPLSHQIVERELERSDLERKGTMKNPTPEDTPGTVVAAQQQEQPPHYIGHLTAHHLRQVEEGIETQESLQMWLHIDNRTRNNRPSPFNGWDHIGLQEALAILREREGTEQTPRELMALVREFQADITDTRQNPKRWTNASLTPERAREWYEQQINRVQQQLQSVAPNESFQRFPREFPKLG
jgi:hypothetical protein